MDEKRRRFEAQVMPHLDAAYRFAMNVTADISARYEFEPSPTSSGEYEITEPLELIIFT